MGPRGSYEWAILSNFVILPSEIIDNAISLPSSLADPRACTIFQYVARPRCVKEAIWAFRSAQRKGGKLESVWEDTSCQILIRTLCKAKFFRSTGNSTLGEDHPEHLLQTSQFRCLSRWYCTSL